MTLELEHDEHGPACAPEEFHLRGVLATRLKCWHRLTEDEVANLLEFVRGLGEQAAEQTPYGWVRMNGVFNSGVFHLGATCPPGWVGAAEAVTLLVAPIQQAAEPVEWPHKWGCRANAFGECNIEALKQALKNAQPSFLSPDWTLVRNEDIAALREALAEQAAESDRSGCAAGSDEECTNRHCATKCPALAEQQAAEPQPSRHRLLEALARLKIRIAFIGWPAESMRNVGTDSQPRWVPDWRYESQLIEHLLNGAEITAPENPADTKPANEIHPAPTQQPLTAERVIECAARLVAHADFQLGGVLGAHSKPKDIPSNAASKVKARHLAALRDALAAHNITENEKGGAA